MNAAVVTVGAEILAGDILDSNFREIARALGDAGVSVVDHRSVPDEEDRIAAAVSRALDEAELVIVTGGLGPTPDDLTREGVARAFGVPLAYREELLPALRAVFASFGRTDLPESNLRQLHLPEGAEPVLNPVGTAPGFRMERGGRMVFVLPGVPQEMRAMLAESVLPWLLGRGGLPHRETRVLRTMGIGESDLVPLLHRAMNTWRGVGVAFYPQQPGVDLKLTHLGKDMSTIRARLDAAEQSARSLLGAYVYGTAGDTLAGAVGRLLVAKGWTAGTAESCTGGAIAAELVREPGASAWFERGVVAYSNRAKAELLGVDETLLAAHGAVSEPVARAMAEGLRARAGVDVAVATTGIAGPTGGSDEKPVGLVHTAVAAPDGTRAWRTQTPGTREAVIRRNVVTAINRLRLVLLGEA